MEKVLYEVKTIGKVNDFLGIAKKLLVDENSIPVRRAAILIENATLKLTDRAVFVQE